MSKQQLVKRMQLFEFNDSSVCPRFLRDSIVEILGRTIKQCGFYDPIAPCFKQFCERAQCKQILDLCSGSGEPVAVLLDALKKNGNTDIGFHLSDLLPPDYNNSTVLKTYPDAITFSPAPVNAMDVDDCPTHQARTLIAGFHHFRPEQAKKILQNSAAANKAICIIEPFTRRLSTTTPFFIKSFLPGMLNPIQTGKDQWLKALFTYVLPLTPLLGWWDTVVSALRMYSREEYFDMVKDLDGFQWEFHEFPVAFGGTVTMFTGVPTLAAETQVPQPGIMP